MRIILMILRAASAGPPFSGSWYYVASACLLRRSQQNRLILRNHDRVFVMRGQAPVARTNGPMIRLYLGAPIARRDNLLDRNRQAIGQLGAEPGIVVIGYARFFVDRAPTPWPHSSRITLNPQRRTSRSTARPISQTRLPARAAFSPCRNAVSAHRARASAVAETCPTLTVTAASATKPSFCAVTSSFTRSPSARVRLPGIPWMASSLTLIHAVPGNP